MVQDYERSERPLWQLIGSETLAVLAAGLLMPFGIQPSTRRSPRQSEQRTVVLVHGYLGNRSSFFCLRACLRAFGVRQVLAFNYDSTKGIEQGARSLKEYLRKHVRGGRIDLVCHSLGGLVARAYLQELGGARRVDRCITLGTPHRGTYNAYWLASRVGRELRPDSPILKRLRASRAQAGNVKFTSIVAGSDNIIIPRVFSAKERTVLIQNVGHLGVLFSPAALREVVESLSRKIRPRSSRV